MVTTKFYPDFSSSMIIEGNEKPFPFMMQIWLNVQICQNWKQHGTKTKLFAMNIESIIGFENMEMRQTESKHSQKITLTNALYGIRTEQ